MTEEKIQGQTAAPQPARRRLLKSTVAIPVIMTLHSGAALARTSNLAGAETTLDNVAGDDSDVFCARVVDQLPEGAYDLGNAPSFTRISRQKDGGINRTPQEIIDACQQQPQPGIILSSGAFNSIGGRTGWTEL
ncbi:MAG: hypothetical protein JNIBNLAF_00510 [Nitrosomonas europaea]|uniref:hypothetical protein n=1 Tax=Nitrosomonas TaxID=914 RepID=UPI0023EF734D|nr:MULTISPECIES: hypothetical protein [Nitrosomonas]MBV6388914.1 hypothetical protein [Nitrosomonas europaea]MCE7917333.1 hypothetical protein [Nitrosomonas sp. PRO5]MEB2331543.1 hypothetical protein [Nitrosomonas sp.]